MKAAHEDTASNGKSAVDHSWIFNGAKPVAAAPREEEDLGEVDAEDEPDGYEIERGVRIVVANEVCGRSRANAETSARLTNAPCRTSLASRAEETRMVGS
eukprot:scaffold2250_cov124-Pinguiococcus_pyrenoidosus.AAC.1